MNHDRAGHSTVAHYRAMRTQPLAKHGRPIRGVPAAWHHCTYLPLYPFSAFGRERIQSS